jgi:malate/lactate dehydrogenase
MERIFEVELTAEEQEMLRKSIELCSGSIDIARKLMAG